mgnify:FL=1
MAHHQPNAITVIHKFIRQELFAAAGLLARATPADSAEVLQTLNAIAAVLRRHGETEDRTLEPQLRQLDPALANHMADDHRHLETQLSRVLVLAEDLEPSQDGLCRELLARLHLDWLKFVGEYLLHLDDEERLLFARMETLPPPSLVGQSASAMPVGERREFLAKLALAINPAELKLVRSALAPEQQDAIGV